LIAGNSINEFTSFEGLASAMNALSGYWGTVALALGLLPPVFRQPLLFPTPHR
jgi:hypothetical protein